MTERVASRGRILVVEDEADVPELLPRLDELLGLAQHLVEVHRGPRRLRRVGVGQNLPHDPGRPVEPLLHRADVTRGSLDVRPQERVPREGEVVRHALEGVVDLVGDPGGQATDGGEPLGVEELPLELADASLLRGPGLEPRAPARLLHGEGAEEQGEAHDGEVQGVGGAVAAPHRLGEPHDRPLRLGTGEEEGRGQRPALGTERGFGVDLGLAGRERTPRTGREAPEDGPLRVAQLAPARGIRRGIAEVEQRSGLDLGLDRHPARQGTSGLAVRQLRGEARA